jgi:O-methyltransferase involved in polyketide biosynthesis
MAKSEITKPRLSGVAETLLITLHIPAMESQRRDALIKDERAEALVRRRRRPAPVSSQKGPHGLGRSKGT